MGWLARLWLFFMHWFVRVGVGRGDGMMVCVCVCLYVWCLCMYVWFFFFLTRSSLHPFFLKGIKGGELLFSRADWVNGGV
ncbi:hypothetical protein F4809DRAFT_11582 [Biscogniauxia mediterranea]|nr:hypothetical protein F4809DRAFT_11582 [Biscogniauxia mediterranea]